MKRSSRDPAAPGSASAGDGRNIASELGVLEGEASEQEVPAKRDGRPRSAIRHAVPSERATSDSREHRRRSGRYASPNVDDAPATPPRKK